MAQCYQNHVQLLIARCPTLDLKTAQELEKQGFLLMDTLVYYEHNLHLKINITLNEKILIRTILPGEAETVRALAAEAFKGYRGHYHADAKLDVHQCDDVYMSWARGILDGTAAESRRGNQYPACDLDLVGFATLRVNDPNEGEGVLFSVSPAAQGLGIYRMFTESGLLWSIRQGMKRMIVSTQITNVAVQKVWARVGFYPTSSFYTFHKWFD